MTDPSDAPGDEADRGLGAEVSKVTDAEWLAGHRRLIESGDIPVEELGYLYDPDRDPSSVAASDLSVERDPAEPEEAS